MNRHEIVHSGLIWKRAESLSGTPPFHLSFIKRCGVTESGLPNGSGETRRSPDFMWRLYGQFMRPANPSLLDPERVSFARPGEAPPVLGEAEASPNVCLWRRS